MMMIFLFEFRNFSKSLPLLWMQEKLLQVWLSLLHCDWYIWWGTHAARCTCGGQRAALQSPLLLPFHLHLGFRSNTGHQAQTTCVFTPEQSRWPSPTFLPETGCLPKPAVVGLGNAGEPVLGCAWQCWSYSVTGRTCFSMVAGDPDSGSHAWAVSASSTEPCCQPLLHFVMIWISYFIRKGTSLSICLLNCSEIYFMS